MFRPALRLLWDREQPAPGARQGGETAGAIPSAANAVTPADAVGLLRGPGRSDGDRAQI